MTITENEVIMMARLGFPLSETQKFIEGMSLGCLLNDALTDKLYECTEEWTGREAERVQNKREAEDGVKKARTNNFFSFFLASSFPLCSGC